MTTTASPMAAQMAARDAAGYTAQVPADARQRRCGTCTHGLVEKRAMYRGWHVTWCRLHTAPVADCGGCPQHQPK